MSARHHLLNQEFFALETVVGCTVDMSYLATFYAEKEQLEKCCEQNQYLGKSAAVTGGCCHLEWFNILLVTLQYCSDATL